MGDTQTAVNSETAVNALMSCPQEIDQSNLNVVHFAFLEDRKTTAVKTQLLHAPIVQTLFEKILLLLTGELWSIIILRGDKIKKMQLACIARR